MTGERMGGLEPRKGMALGSLVLAIGSFLVVCAGPLLSIPAIILGFVARSRANRDPREYGGQGMALAGAIVGIVNLVAMPLIWFASLPFILVALATFIPAMAKAQEAAVRTSDEAQAKQIMLAIMTYSADHGDTLPPHLAAVTDMLSGPE